MLTSRQQIIETIRSQGQVTALDLSRILGMTQANARHHLTLLAEQGAIIKSAERRSSAKGRPAAVYELSDGVLGHNLELLIEALFAEAAGTIPLERLAARMLGADFPRPKNMLGLLSQLMGWLNQHHYAARWEAHQAGPRLLLQHCPYRSILAHQPELCELDRLILSQYTQMPVRLCQTLAAQPHGGNHCTFQIERR